MFVALTKLEKFSINKRLPTTVLSIIQNKSINILMEKIGRRRKSINSSVEILDYPVRNEKILRNFDLLLPKFHFILPNFYFPSPWGKFVYTLKISDFLGRRVTAGGMHGQHLARARPLCQSETYNPV